VFDDRFMMHDTQASESQAYVSVVSDQVAKYVGIIET